MDRHAIQPVKPGMTTDQYRRLWPSAEDFEFEDEEVFGLQFGRGVGLACGRGR